MSIHPDGEPDDHPGNDSGHSTWVLKDSWAWGALVLRLAPPQRPVEGWAGLPGTVRPGTPAAIEDQAQLGPRGHLLMSQGLRCKVRVRASEAPNPRSPDSCLLPSSCIRFWLLELWGLSAWKGCGQDGGGGSGRRCCLQAWGAFLWPSGQGPPPSRASFGFYTHLAVGGDGSPAIARETEAVVSQGSRRCVVTGPEWRGMQGGLGC